MSDIRMQRMPMMTKCIFLKITVVSIIILIMAGCSSPQSSPAEQGGRQPVDPITATVISDIPTKIIKTEEAASGFTSTPWQMPTLALLLPPAQASEKIRSLFEATKACSVPCWWGIVPGKTTYSQVLEVNAGLVQEFSPSQDRSSAPALHMIYQNDEIPFRSDIFYEFTDDVVQYIQIDSQRTSAIYALDKLYKQYGLPESSNINVYSGLKGSKQFIEVSVLFEYRSKGAAFLYSGNGAVNSKGDIAACFDNGIDPKIYLWTEEHWSSYTGALYYEYRVFKPMEEVSNTLAQGFFESLIKNGSTCINVSPLSEWPSN